MSPKASIIELERMTPPELGRELRGKHAELAKMRLGLTMGSEKNHAKYKAIKKDAARMAMVLRNMEKKGMTTKAPKAETAPKTSKVAKKSVEKASAFAKATADKASPKSKK
jgi:ribosomal protein L29